MKNGPHILICSESGTAKSTAAASIIASPPALRSGRPVLVQLFDPADKGAPYRERGDAIVREKGAFCDVENITRDGALVAVIEKWHEQQGRGSQGITMRGGEKVKTAEYTLQGQLFESYLERMRAFTAEVADGTWYAYINDSVTFMNDAVRSYLSGVMLVNDNQMIWAQATDELERFYLRTFSDLPITTVIIAHAVPERVTMTDERGRKKRMRGEADDVPYEVAAPGRLGRDIFAAYGEIYRGYITYERNKESRKNEPVYWLQTRNDGIWRCASQLHVANPLGPWREGEPNTMWKAVFATVRGR